MWVRDGPPSWNLNDAPVVLIIQIRTGRNSVARDQCAHRDKALSQRRRSRHQHGRRAMAGTSMTAVNFDSSASRRTRRRASRKACIAALVGRTSAHASSRKRDHRDAGENLGINGQ